MLGEMPVFHQDRTFSFVEERAAFNEQYGQTSKQVHCNRPNMVSYYVIIDTILHIIMRFSGASGLVSDAMPSRVQSSNVEFEAAMFTGDL